MKRLLLSQRSDIGPHGDRYDWLEHYYITYFTSLGCHVFPVPNNEHQARMLLAEGYDGIVLTGGGVFRDYGEISQAQQTCYNNRSNIEDVLIEYAINRNKPLLGICRGMQKINAYLGGSESVIGDYIKPGETHRITTEKGVFTVNHYHPHEVKQDELGQGLKPLAFDSERNTVEAFTGNKVLGLQWHPERELADKASREWNDSLIANFLGL